MAITSGFYNAFLVDGEYDRVYNAENYNSVFSAFIGDGVRRSGDNDLYVSVVSGTTVLSIGIGQAICGGHWVMNDAAVLLDAITPPVGDYDRVDAVVLRVNTTEAVRAASVFVRTGTAAANPVPPARETGTGIHELILATVRSSPSSTTLTVTDTRGDKNYCGWITTPIGYDEYFANLDAAFNLWFEEKKDTLASTTLFKRYEWRTTLTNEASSVTFDIPQYDSTGVDILDVFVNGLRETEGVDFSLDGSVITFLTTGGGSGVKTAGTEIVVVSYKSIDGTGLGTVADEVTALQQAVSDISVETSYTYVCNGVNDNVLLSQLAADWLGGGDDYSSKIIRVYGTFGASAAYSGAGTEASPFVWFRIGEGGASNRKIVFDFTGCSQINIACATGTHNVIFFGLHANVIGANVNATGGSTINMFSTAALTTVCAERCRFWITSQSGLIARGGTFRDCRTSLTTTGGNAQSFSVLTGGLLRIFGGEHYAYSPSTGASSVVYVNSAQTGAVVLTYGMSCPSVSRSGYVQTYAVNCLTQNAKCSFTDTVTTLPITANGQNIRGTIVASMAGMM